MTQPSLDFTAAIHLRDHGMSQVAQHAEDNRLGFAEQARAYVLVYLQTFGPTSGEVLTDACIASGIKPHDRRAFGTVYYTLARRGQIRKVGECKRLRGHNTSGGNIWAIAE